MVRKKTKRSDADAREFKQQLCNSINYSCADRIHDDVGSEVPSTLVGEGMDWLLSGQCRRLWQMGHAPEYLRAIFGSLPHELRATLAGLFDKLDKEEYFNVQCIRQHRSQFNLDLVDDLLGSGSPYKEQLACEQCEFNQWEGADYGVLCYMWDRLSNERLGCYANASLAQLCGISAGELLHRIVNNSLPPTCPQLDHLFFMLEDLSCSSSTLVSTRYARWKWPGGEPKLMQFLDRKLFDASGRTAVCVTLVRELSVEEWDKAASEQGSPLRRLAATMGDRRSGRELLADFEHDMRQPLASHPALHALASLASNFDVGGDVRKRLQQLEGGPSAGP